MSPILYEVGITDLICGFILGWQSGAYHFLVTLTLTLTVDLIFRFSCLEHISYIANNIPQIFLMLDKFLWGLLSHYSDIFCLT